MDRIHIEHGSALGGLTWIALWLFTVGYLGLDFLQGALALVLWPYFLGASFSS